MISAIGQNFNVKKTLLVPFQGTFLTKKPSNVDTVDIKSRTQYPVDEGFLPQETAVEFLKLRKLQESGRQAEALKGYLDIFNTEFKKPIASFENDKDKILHKTILYMAKNGISRYFNASGQRHRIAELNKYAANVAYAFEPDMAAEMGKTIIPPESLKPFSIPELDVA